MKIKLSADQKKLAGAWAILIAIILVLAWMAYGAVFSHPILGLALVAGLLGIRFRS